MATRDAIMHALTQHDFATPAQLAYMCGVQLPAVCKATKQLADKSLIVIESGFRPAILRLSWTGARAMDTTLTSGKRTPSASVQQHACHRNEAGIMLAQRYPGFAWTPKTRLLQHGLRPAIGEHGAADTAGRAYLVLLDDYMMAPGRILRTWHRRHAPDPHYYAEPAGRRWCELANHFIVATTSAQQADRHQRWIARYHRECRDDTVQLPNIEVLCIQPIWSLF